jgi:hypothetical protein
MNKEYKLALDGFSELLGERGQDTFIDSDLRVLLNRAICLWRLKRYADAVRFRSTASSVLLSPDVRSRTSRHQAS